MEKIDGVNDITEKNNTDPHRKQITSSQSHISFDRQKWQYGCSIFTQEYSKLNKNISLMKLEPLDKQHNVHLKE